MPTREEAEVFTALANQYPLPAAQAAGIQEVKADQAITHELAGQPATAGNSRQLGRQPGGDGREIGLGAGGAASPMNQADTSIQPNLSFAMGQDMASLEQSAQRSAAALNLEQSIQAKEALRFHEEMKQADGVEEMAVQIEQNQAESAKEKALEQQQHRARDYER